MPLTYLIFAGLLYIVLDYLFGIKIDIREPPIVPSTLPWEKVSHPIYTLAVPRSKIYVTTNIEIISNAQKNSKNLDFGRFTALFMARMCGISKDGTTKLTGENHKNVDLFHRLMKTKHSGLAYGDQLESVHRDIVGHLQLASERLSPPGAEPAKLNLLEWLQYEATVATCRAIWGPENPINSPEIVNAFHTFKAGVLSLVIGVVPSLAAGKAYYARTICANAFAQYYRAEGHHQASQFIRDYYNIATEQGLSLDDIARLQISILFASVSNTIPMAFWAVYHVYSSPPLLGECRKELAAIVRETEPTPALASKDACPLLQSVAKETIRLHACGSTTRYVMQDTPLLGDKYLLKQGTLLSMPTEVIHTDTKVWGPDAASFNPYRFQKQSKGSKADGTDVKGMAFMAFGMGASICPGRHLALREVASVVAMLIGQFDIEPVDGSWTIERGKADDLFDAIRLPGNDVEVVMRRRK